MTYRLVRDLAAEKIPVRLTCGALGFSAQAYYAWLANPIGTRDLEDVYLTNALIDAHSDDPEFGYPFLADELRRAGLAARECRVRRLCSQQRLRSTTVRKGSRGKADVPARPSTMPTSSVTSAVTHTADAAMLVPIASDDAVDMHVINNVD